MRVNVYTQELTDEVLCVSKRGEDGRLHHGIRFVLEGSPRLHARPDDDDRPGVTFWLARDGRGRPEELAELFQKAVALIDRYLNREV